MPQNALSRRALLVSAALALAVRPAPADEKGDKPKLSGTWEKKDGEMMLEFQGDELTLYPHGDKANFGIGCSYTATKDGVVKVKVKDFDGPKELVEKAKELVPVGTEFQFKWKVDGEAATLDAMEGKDIEHIKDRLEGGFAKKS